MKKLFYLFLLLPFSLLFSCSDDKDFSPVDLTLTLSGVTMSNDNFYTVAGETVTIDGLDAKAIDGKNSGVSNLIFYWNGVPLLGQPGDPFNGEISTENLPAGTYTLGVTGYMLQEGASLMDFAASYTLTVVSSIDDLPAGAPEIGTYSTTMRFSTSN